MDELAKELTLEMFASTELYYQIAEAIGTENFYKLAGVVGGTTIYIPKPESLIRPVRDAHIKAEFNGYNHPELKELVDKVVLPITSLLAKIMTEPGMRFVIGHECGHIAMGHVIYHTAASTLGQLSQILPLVGPLVSRSISYPLNAWSRRSEITADRAGFLCCGNLEQSKRTLLQIESAFAPADTLDLDSYMENSRQFLKKGLLRRLGEYGANHPLTPKRIQALDLFAQSELYYQATGQKAPEGAVSASDLAQRTEAVIKVL